MRRTSLIALLVLSEAIACAASYTKQFGDAGGISIQYEMISKTPAKNRYLFLNVISGTITNTTKVLIRCAGIAPIAPGFSGPSGLGLVVSLDAGTSQTFSQLAEFRRDDNVVVRTKNVDGPNISGWNVECTTPLNYQYSDKQTTKADLREAKAGLGRVIATKGDAAYVLACANLLNAALNKRLRLYRGAQRLEKEVYSFRAHLCKSVEQIVEHAPEGTDTHVAPDDLILIRVNGIQFSFHAISRTPSLRAYAASESNTLQEWSGIRLQPVASLVLAWARAVLAEEGPVRT